MAQKVCLQDGGGRQSLAAYVTHVLAFQGFLASHAVGVEQDLAVEFNCALDALVNTWMLNELAVPGQCICRAKALFAVVANESGMENRLVTIP